MEVENELNQNCSLLMQMLATTTTLPIITATLSYIDLQELQILAQIGLYRFQESKFFNIVVSKVFINKYLNRVDRSLFFMFYEDEEFRIIQQNTTNILASKHSEFLAQTFKTTNIILRFLQITTQFLNLDTQFQSLIQQLFFEPELPMPKLKRETIGMYCQTALQQHLSLIKFLEDDFEQIWLEQPIQELKTKLQEEIYEEKQKISQLKEKIIGKIRDVRFFGYRVNYSNWKSYLIPSFKAHNIIVFLLTLCSQLVFTYQQLIVNIQDPFMKFTDFALRSNIYRNIVLSVEQKFNFIFKIYNEHCTNYFSIYEQVPPMNFWRPAMSIWIQNMKQFHEQNKLVYNYITAKLRQINMNEFLKIKTEKLPSFFSELKKEVQFQIYSQQRKNKVYSKLKDKVQIQSFFQNNNDVYQTLAKDYVEYMIDISINQFNVHFCGYSEHIIKEYPLFKDYNQNAVRQSLDFYQQIRQTINRSVPNQIQLNIFKEVVKQDLLFSQTRLYKPVIVRQIVQILNKWIKNQLQSIPGFAVFDQQGFAKHKIVLDFQQKDGLLKYFASKNNIEYDCPQQLEFYYNIQLQDKDIKHLKQIDQQNVQQMQQYFSDQGEMQEQL